MIQAAHGKTAITKVLMRFSEMDVWTDGFFYSVQEAKRIIKSWLEEYNTEKPHGALSGVTPASYLKEFSAKKAA